MANKFLDQNGLLYFWQKIVNKFVAKETGKGLSTNDFTNELKTKLDGIAEGANKTTVEDVLTSTSTTNALSANQGKALDEKIKNLSDSMSNLGYGDMLKTTYDTDDNGKVDNADNADKLDGQSSSYYAKATDITELESALDNKIETSSLGQANGVATLDETGLIPSTQLPSYVDDVVEGYAKTTTSDSGVVTVDGFYKEAEFTTAITGETGKIYVDLSTNISYRYGGTTFVQITSSDMTALTNAEIDTIVAS